MRNQSERMWLWGRKEKRKREKAIENDEWRWWWHGLFDGDCDGNDEVNTVVVIGLTAWVSWGDTGLDGLAESSCCKMMMMMLLLYYRVFDLWVLCDRLKINHSCTWSPCSNFLYNYHSRLTIDHCVCSFPYNTFCSCLLTVFVHFPYILLRKAWSDDHSLVGGLLLSGTAKFILLRVIFPCTW